MTCCCSRRVSFGVSNYGSDTFASSIRVRSSARAPESIPACMERDRLRSLGPDGLNVLLELAVQRLRYSEPNASHLIEHMQWLRNIPLPIALSKKAQSTDHCQSECGGSSTA